MVSKKSRFRGRQTLREWLSQDCHARYPRFRCIPIFSSPYFYISSQIIDVPRQFRQWASDTLHHQNCMKLAAFKSHFYYMCWLVVTCAVLFKFFLRYIYIHIYFIKFLTHCAIYVCSTSTFVMFTFKIQQYTSVFLDQYNPQKV